MDDGSHGSAKLLAAACLTFCGVVIMAVGIATAGMPLERPVCLAFAPIPCCSANADRLAQTMPLVSPPGTRAMRILTD